MDGLKINLIPGEEKAGFEVILLSKKVKSLATLLIILFILTLGFTALLFIRLNSSINNLSLKITNTENKIKSFQAKEEYLVILKNRLNLVDQIIKRRTGINEILATLDKIAPSQVTFELIDSGAKGGLRVSASSSDLKSLNELYKNISQPDFTENLKSLTISSITKSKENTYNFFIEIVKN